MSALSSCSTSESVRLRRYCSVSVKETVAATRLVEFECAGHRAIEPERIAGALAEFDAVASGQQRHRQAEHFDRLARRSRRPPYQIHARHDVAVLVRAAKLDRTFARAIQRLEVGRLQQVVRELGERDALRRFQPSFDAERSGRSRRRSHLSRASIAETRACRPTELRKSTRLIWRSQSALFAIETGTIAACASKARVAAYASARVKKE